MDILLTGATGNVGKEVARELRVMGVPFRVGTVKPGKIVQIDANMEIRRFDFLDPTTFEGAFDGIKHLFLVRPPALADVPKELAPAIRAAVAAGVQHIVFLSLQGVENNRVTPHYKIEQLILELGVRYTFLRASFFMQNLSTTSAHEIKTLSEIRLPVGKAKTSFIDVRDIAAVAARALTDSAHENQKYTLTGGEALDYFQVAEKLSAALNRPIRYTHPSVITFVIRQLAEGKALGYSLVVAALYTITRFGNAKEVTGTVEALLGRPPITFDQFARDNRAVWE